MSAMLILGRVVIGGLALIGVSTVAAGTALYVATKPRPTGRSPRVSTRWTEVKKPSKRKGQHDLREFIAKEARRKGAGKKKVRSNRVSVTH